jgi:hypothetical protein
MQQTLIVGGAIAVIALFAGLYAFLQVLSPGDFWHGWFGEDDDLQL